MQSNSSSSTTTKPAPRFEEVGVAGVLLLPVAAALAADFIVTGVATTGRVLVAPLITVVVVADVDIVAAEEVLTTVQGPMEAGEVDAVVSAGGISNINITCRTLDMTVSSNAG